VLDHERIWRERRSRVEHPALEELLDEMLVGDPTERLEEIGRAVEVVDEVATAGSG